MQPGAPMRRPSWLSFPACDPLHRFVKRQVDAMYWTNSLSEVDLLNRAGPIMRSSWRAEQLVDIGAAQRIEHRYFVGPTIARLGRRWQPDPQLRHAACEPVRRLRRKPTRPQRCTCCTKDGPTWSPPQ